ncbi:MAG: hypothetical protein HW378_177 [Anaerolineales bacterium]|nr:hypothetical protein [Anaerolineales bacterium]
MKQWRTYGGNDEEEVLDGDNGFLGVNTRVDPSQLEAGYVAAAVNQRFDSGVAGTRRGLRLLSWSNQAVPGSPALIKPIAPPTGIPGVSQMHGAGVFNDPATSLKWLIVAAGNGTWRCREGNGASQVPLPAGVTITGRVQLLQCANRMLMLRGPTAAPLQMTNLDVGFTALTAPTLPNIGLPNASVGVWFQNRLWVLVNRDELWVSLFLEPWHGPAVNNLFKISQGEAEEAVGLYPFNDETLVVGKQRSLYVLSDLLNTADGADPANPLAPLLTGMRQYPVTREYGCLAARSFAAVGSDVWFLAPGRGVCSVRQTEQNKLQGVDAPVSRDIQSLVDQINWAYAGNAVAAFHGNRYYLAVPWRTSTVNNAVLVFDTLNRAWCGYDTLPSATEGVKEWVKFDYAGTIRLGFISENGFVYLYEDGFMDHLADTAGNVTFVPIAGQLFTRGYHGGPAGFKKGAFFRASLQTWWPKYSIQWQTDGMGETGAIVSDQTRSRTRYFRPWDKAAWDASNVNDDHATAYREDYAIHLSGAETILIGSGLDFDRVQEYQESRPVRTAGKHLQLAFSSSQGRVEVRNVMLAARAGSRRQGVQA